MLGVINVNKEKGFTSHDIVAILRRVLGTKKVGHTGTLDPDATGVLPVCIGRATKFADRFMAENKTYIAEIILGVTTNTGDISGQILDRKMVCFDMEQIARVVQSFQGNMMQTPPMFSAIKIKGQRMYELARKGKHIDIPARPITIHEISILDFFPDTHRFIIQVTCSKGTYIRSLATDIGERLGCGGTMGELTRTVSGMFCLKNAYTLDQIKSAKDVRELILPLEKLLPYPIFELPDAHLVHGKNGNPLPNFTPLSTGDTCWLHHRGEWIGLYKVKEGKIRPEVML